MKVSVFVGGTVLLVIMAALSYYPAFPEGHLIMTVHMECTSNPDSVLPFETNDLNYCAIAQQWIIGLSALGAVGFAIMIAGSFMNRMPEGKYANP